MPLRLLVSPLHLHRDGRPGSAMADSHQTTDKKGETHSYEPRLNAMPVPDTGQLGACAAKGLHPSHSKQGGPISYSTGACKTCPKGRGEFALSCMPS